MCIRDSNIEAAPSPRKKSVEVGAAVSIQRFDRLRSFLFPFFASPLAPIQARYQRASSAFSAHFLQRLSSASSFPSISLSRSFFLFVSIAPQKTISAPSAGRQRRLAAGKRQLTAGKSRLRTTSSGFDDSFHRQTRWRSRCADESIDSMQHRRVTKGAACQAGGS